MSLGDDNSSTRGDKNVYVVTGFTKDRNGNHVPGKVDVTPIEFIDTPQATSQTIAATIGGGGSDGIGSFPGMRCRPGQRVLCQYLNDQTLVAYTTLADSEATDKSGPFGKAGDYPTTGPFVPVDELFNAVRSGKPSEGMKQLLQKVFGTQDWRSISKEQAISAIQQFAREDRDAIAPGGKKVIEKIIRYMKNPLRNEQVMGTAGSQIEKKVKSIGGNASKDGSIKDPTAYIKKLLGKKGELIKGAQQMMEKLKSAGAAGLPISGAGAVGGLGNWQGALASVASSQASQQSEDKDESDYLCELFKTLFPDFPCRIDDIDTEQFRKWKREYLAALENEDEGSV
jgi:hypothetical protein